MRWQTTEKDARETTGMLVCILFWVVLVLLLSGCDMQPTTKRAVAKIASVEAAEVGFGGGSESVYRLAADDHTTCRVSPGFYATVQLPARVTCYWDNQ